MTKYVYYKTFTGDSFIVGFEGSDTNEGCIKMLKAIEYFLLRYTSPSDRNFTGIAKCILTAGSIKSNGQNVLSVMFQMSVKDEDIPVISDYLNLSAQEKHKIYQIITILNPSVVQKEHIVI